MPMTSVDTQGNVPINIGTKAFNMAFKKQIIII